MKRMNMKIRECSVLLAVLFACIAAVMTPALAQSNEGQVELEQIELKEAHVLGYLKIGKKLGAVFDRIDQAQGEPDKKLLADLEAVAKEGGYSSFDELEAVVSNITFVMSGINDENGSFKEPSEVLKEELAETEADQSIKGEEKEQLIASIKESIANTPKLKFKSNVALIQKHFKALSKLFEE
jgi:hypothetical protein